MATVTQITGDLVVTGSITGGIARTTITSEGIQYNLPFTDFRVWDAMQTILPGTAAADDLALTTGTFGTVYPYVSSGDLNAAGAITRRARMLWSVPAEFVAGQNFTINAEAGMLTSVASVSATVDFEIYSYNAATLANTIAGDRVTTSATSINSTTFAIYSFLVNGSSVALEPGDLLDIRMTIAANSATASTHFAVVSALYFVPTVKA